MKTVRYLLLAAAAVTLSACTTASERSRQQTLSITVRSGVKTPVAKNWHINDDCSQIDYPAMTIAEKPKHGRLEIVHEPVYPKLDGKQSKCATTKVNGVVAYYTPNPGYTGRDRLIIRSPYEAGKIEEGVLSVTVVK
ncbi:hypothetical protein IB267_23460 [Ensifer sp. ENS09]|uniref:hypothetical protein n=1 Tax=Ensifer sp. ENS09 TaxID=2769263 RepID=UPI001783CA53|nr:hypothetical protein [Ensifer sp. ENS09]